MPVRTVPFFDHEMVGLERLAQLGQALFGDSDPQEFLYRGRPYWVERDDGGYTLSVELPFATREEISLSRSADELVLQVGAWRRNLVLPRLLLDARDAGRENGRSSAQGPLRGAVKGRCRRNEEWMTRGWKDLERRLDELEGRSSAMERAMDAAMVRSKAAMSSIMPDETRRHMRAGVARTAARFPQPDRPLGQPIARRSRRRRRNSPAARTSRSTRSRVLPQVDGRRLGLRLRRPDGLAPARPTCVTR